MLFYVSFTAAVLALVCGAAFTKYVHPEARKASITAGIVAADIIMAIPLAVYEVGESAVEGGTNVAMKIGSYISAVALDTLSLVVAEIRIDDYAAIVSGAALNQYLGSAYLLLLRILYVATPAVIAVAAYSFFTRQFSKNRTRLSVRSRNQNGCKINVFKGMNSRSVGFVRQLFPPPDSESGTHSIAKRFALRKKELDLLKSKPVCIFTDVSKDDKEKYSSDIDRLYGFPVHFTEMQIRELFQFFNRCRQSSIRNLKDLHVFFFDDKEGDNLSNAISFIEFLTEEAPCSQKVDGTAGGNQELNRTQSVDAEMAQKCVATSPRFYKGRPRYHIYCACHGRSDEIALDSVDGSEGFDIRVVDKGRDVVYDLIWRHPILPKSIIPKNKTEKNSYSRRIDIIIVGCGHYGFEALRACCWAGTYPGTKTSIHVIDLKERTVFRDEVEFWSPGVTHSGLVDIYYHQADVTAPSFLAALESIRLGGSVPISSIGAMGGNSDHRSDALEEGSVPYCIIAVGQDDLNTDTAIAVRRFFYGDGLEPVIVPDIYVDIYDQKRHDVVAHLRAKDQTFSFEAFGGITSIFEEKHLVYSQLESLAQNVNASYSYFFTDRRGEDEREGSISHAESAIDYESIVKRNPLFSQHLHQYLFLSYSAWRMNRLSSITNAISVKSKLHYLSFSLEETGDEKQSFGEDNNIALRKLIHGLSQREFETLTRWEHDCWMLFYFGEGWSTVSAETSEIFRKKGLNDKEHSRHDSHLLMRHPYLCDYDEMKQVAIQLHRGDPAKHDEHLVRDMPAILNDSLGISGIRYYVKSLNDPEGRKRRGIGSLV